MERILDVFIDTKKVGYLIEENNIWSFQYDQDWLDDPHGHYLSPDIPLTAKKLTDGSSVRHIQWFFDNLLPEEKARELLAKDIKTPIDDVFALLTKAGAESAGALTLLPPDTPMPEGEVHELNDFDMSKRIQSLPKTSMNRQERKRMSLAGAQHKMLVVYHQGQIYEPSGQMPSTHILKPEHSSPDIFFQSPRNEWYSMKLARACGLVVPDVDIKYFPEPAYLIERFDRKGTYPHQGRIHTLDGCQLLGIPHLSKYTNSTAQSLTKLSRLTRMQALTKLNIFRWVCFNTLLGNTDAHLKNLSFFVHHDTTIMAPHYDLLSTAIYMENGKHLDDELSQPMGNARFLSDVSLANIVDFGEQIGMPKKLSMLELSKMIKKIIPASMLLLQEVEATPQSRYKAGEIRMLRLVHHKCILEMSQKLSS